MPIQIDIERYEELVRKEAEYDILKTALSNMTYSFDVDEILKLFGIKKVNGECSNER